MSNIRVRMYRQGLGDCFLLSFTDASDKTSHMLIDCGVLTGTKNATDNVRKVVRNIRETTQGELSTLVVTHEHGDHVSGFVQAREEFDALEIRNIWLAWTEDGSNALANELRRKKEKVQLALDVAQQRMRAAGAASALPERPMTKSLGLFGGFDDPLGAAKPAGTKAAMAWVREHPTALQSLLRPGEAPIAIPLVDGFRAYVLGPPEDLKLLKKDRPSARTPEVYHLGSNFNMGLVNALVDNAGGSASPFDASFLVAPAAARKQPFFKNVYYGGDAWRQIDADWLMSSEGMALQLDSDTNNTSLVLAIEHVQTGKVLLFPGDAQVGNWLSWQSYSWKVEQPNGSVGEVDAVDLLRRTVLYKVGHHGSHNATLREQGLEMMTSPHLVALIPVDAEKARSLEWRMPFDPLMQRLHAKTRGRVLRSDQGLPVRPDDVAGRVWDEFVNCVNVDPLYVDYTVAL